MFTGLVEAVGRVEAVEPRGGGARLSLLTDLELARGDSVSVSGACLTVEQLSESGFAADLSVETCRRTTLGALRAGAAVNLERAVQLGARLGGHLVTGHVDGLAEVLETSPAGDALCVLLRAPGELVPFLAPKGSVVLDGVSLTVNQAHGVELEVMLIPHTRSVTTLATLAVGQRLNLEVDLIARHVVHYLRSQTPS